MTHDQDYTRVWVCIKPRGAIFGFILGPFFLKQGSLQVTHTWPAEQTAGDAIRDLQRRRTSGLHPSLRGNLVPETMEGSRGSPRQRNKKRHDDVGSASKPQ